MRNEGNLDAVEKIRGCRTCLIDGGPPVKERHKLLLGNFPILVPEHSRIHQEPNESSHVLNPAHLRKKTKSAIPFSNSCNLSQK